MGYYSTYDLEVQNVTKEEADRIAEWIEDRKLCIDPDYYDCKGENGYYEFSHTDIMKWYEYEEDMIELSQQFPRAIFRLCGAGDDRCDIWHCYFKNGESEFCPGIIRYDKPEVITGWRY